MVVKPWSPLIDGKRGMIKHHFWGNPTERSERRYDEIEVFLTCPSIILHIVSQVFRQGWSSSPRWLHIPRPTSPSSPSRARRQASGTLLAPESPGARKDTEITLMQSSIWVTTVNPYISYMFFVVNPWDNFMAKEKQWLIDCIWSPQQLCIIQSCQFCRVHEPASGFVHRAHQAISWKIPFPSAKWTDGVANFPSGQSQVDPGHRDVQDTEMSVSRGTCPASPALANVRMSTLQLWKAPKSNCSS